MQPSFNVAVIGLGSMGMGAALSCIRAGLTTHGVDLSANARERLMAAGAASVTDDSRALAPSLDAVLLLLVNASQVRQVLFGEQGIASSLCPGTAIMLSVTMSAEDAKTIASELTALGLLVLDAPVSGGAVKAEAGEMTVMASGSDAAFIHLEPLLSAIASNVFNIGQKPGQGSLVKIIHQLLAGVHIAVAAEAMALASRANIPLHLLYEVVTNAAGNSWMFQNRMPRVLTGDYAPRSAVEIFVKDLNLVAETAKALHFPVPLANTALNLFLSASNAGYGQQDDSAVIKAYQGIVLPQKENP